MYVSTIVQLIFTACLSVILLNCASHAGRTGSSSGLIPVQFTYVNPKANEVSIAGTFNGWSPSLHHFAKKGDTWTILIELPPGRYSYDFVVDGRTWLSDTAAPLWEDTGFGARNSVLIVE